ncbi:MAG: hypothetical protein V3U73_05385 [bacterium]
MFENEQKEKMKPGYFDRPETRKKLWVLLWGSCIFSVIAEIFVHRHGHFGAEGSNSIDGWLGFYAFLGFLSCLALILIAKFLGLFLKKRPDYYDDRNQ